MANDPKKKPSAAQKRAWAEGAKRLKRINAAKRVTTTNTASRGPTRQERRRTARDGEKMTTKTEVKLEKRTLKKPAIPLSVAVPVGKSIYDVLAGRDKLYPGVIRGIASGGLKEGLKQLDNGIRLSTVGKFRDGQPADTLLRENKKLYGAGATLFTLGCTKLARPVNARARRVSRGIFEAI